MRIGIQKTVAKYCTNFINTFLLPKIGAQFRFSGQPLDGWLCSSKKRRLTSQIQTRPVIENNSSHIDSHIQIQQCNVSVGGVPLIEIAIDKYICSSQHFYCVCFLKLLRVYIPTLKIKELQGSHANYKNV